jgi:hypothetical protein
MSCAPVKFCSPPNWHTDFPDLIGPTGPAGATGPAGVAGQAGPVAVTGLKVSLYGDLEAGQVYILDLKAWDAYTITDVTTKLASGTATVTLKIDGVAVTGLTAINLTTSKLDFLATAANLVSVGAEVTIEVVAATNAFNLDLSINTIPV